MNINFLQINASDIKWGASIEAYRLHKAFLEQGHNSRILCAIKASEDKCCSEVMPFYRGYLANALIGKAFNFVGLQSFGYPSSFFLRRSKLIRDFADVVILRNLHWWYFSIGVLPYLAVHKPLIWRLPDMWALTGHCAYSYECERWLSGCGRCPHLFDYPELFFETTHFLWKRKKSIYEKLKRRLVFVSPSLWLKKLVERSPLTKDFRCELIPTAVDLNEFSPGRKEEARKGFDLKNNESVVLFSAFKYKDKRKGIDFLPQVVGRTSEKLNKPLVLLVAGIGNKKMSFSPGIRVVYAGFQKDSKSLARLYSAADVYLSLSSADNLPNTLVEAQACGLPVVALDRGGCKEAIDEGQSGYAVKDINSACQALISILSEEAKINEFSANARRKAQKEFSMELQVKRFVSLAKELRTSK